MEKTLSFWGLEFIIILGINIVRLALTLIKLPHHVILMIFLLGIRLLIALRHLIHRGTHCTRCISDVVDGPLRLPMQPLLLAACHAHMIFKLYFKSVWLVLRRILQSLRAIFLDVFRLFL